ncbi:hypothetical protein AS594_39695 [Streptomyces agglomeratus]|uniref:HEAT repeat domain-containing protein n=1 Tax=Streptomyces agglomeratus TaxID=285458 RepID=A0A1E5NZA2_9ACTN|nr:HEAT repeat domain-containing protein [Streptomyces agglomeratus]OEJ21643.1 hypothetical protein AS594_39695 [Streptomyces agglomeratus]
MIESAQEFIRLRYSENPQDYQRASTDEASYDVWIEVIAHHQQARMWVAQNKSVPLEILQILAADPDPSVRVMVAMKRKLTPDILDQLASDPDESVRLAVARNKKASKGTLERLLSDDWGEVRSVARERLGFSS